MSENNTLLSNVEAYGHFLRFIPRSLKSFGYWYPSFYLSDVASWLKVNVNVYCLEKSMDRGAWWATVQGVAKSQTQLSH